ncbi:unnamed protein product [Ceutorhynchus assimilis]|uniref:MADF domain-containing protein n=1 Tax=Ceutorhynchus assimilis TaxID=467358 RepID=A0A9N9MY78_9CUCU|nr:unnamed protein product [Ceutorhynchus assimilis]
MAYNSIFATVHRHGTFAGLGLPDSRPADKAAVADRQVRFMASTHVAGLHNLNEAYLYFMDVSEEVVKAGTNLSTVSTKLEISIVRRVENYWRAENVLMRIFKNAGDIYEEGKLKAAAENREVREVTLCDNPRDKEDEDGSRFKFQRRKGAAAKSGMQYPRNETVAGVYLGDRPPCYYDVEFAVKPLQEDATLLYREVNVLRCTLDLMIYPLIHLHGEYSLQQNDRDQANSLHEYNYCKKRWTALRDNFRKCLKARKTTSGQANIPTKKWKYEDIMSFMIPFYAERTQKSNLEESEVQEQPREQRLNISDDEVDADITNDNDNAMNDFRRPPSANNNTIHSQGTPNSREYASKFNRQQQSTPMTKVLTNYFEEKQASTVSKQRDHLQKIFDAMQETVRTFSPRLQIEIKSKISNMVSEYELKDLMSKELPNMPPNGVRHSSTRSESAGSPLLSPGSETYPIQWQVQMSDPPYSSSNQSPFSRSPIVIEVSENSNSFQVQDQSSSRNENYTIQWQDQTNVPGLNSIAAPRLYFANSRLPSRFTQEKEKANNSDINCKNYQEL